MSFKVYGILVLVLAVGLTVVVLLQGPKEEPPSASTSQSADPFSSPEAAGPPSKENASESVKSAIGHLREVVENDPGNADALFELARLLQDAHQAQEALKHFANGLKIRPDNTGARVDYSLCLFETGKPEEALEQNRIVLTYDRGNTKALYNIGAVFANRGVRDSAEVYWNRLIRIAPDDELAEQARSSIARLRELSSGR